MVCLTKFCSKISWKEVKKFPGFISFVNPYFDTLSFSLLHTLSSPSLSETNFLWLLISLTHTFLSVSYPQFPLFLYPFILIFSVEKWFVMSLNWVKDELNLKNPGYFSSGIVRYSSSKRKIWLEPFQNSVLKGNTFCPFLAPWCNCGQSVPRFYNSLPLRISSMHRCCYYMALILIKFYTRCITK